MTDTVNLVPCFPTLLVVIPYSMYIVLSVPTISVSKEAAKFFKIFLSIFLKFFKVKPVSSASANYLSCKTFL